MVNALPLPGCTPEPLMGYLKALGLFRLVAVREVIDRHIGTRACHFHGAPATDPTRRPRHQPIFARKIHPNNSCNV